MYWNEPGQGWAGSRQVVPGSVAGEALVLGDPAAGFAGDFASGFAGDCPTLPRMAARMRASEADISACIRVSKASNRLVNN